MAKKDIKAKATIEGMLRVLPGAGVESILRFFCDGKGTCAGRGRWMRILLLL